MNSRPVARGSQEAGFTHLGTTLLPSPVVLSLGTKKFRRASSGGLQFLDQPCQIPFWRWDDNAPSLLSASIRICIRAPFQNTDWHSGIHHWNVACIIAWPFFLHRTCMGEFRHQALVFFCRYYEAPRCDHANDTQRFRSLPRPYLHINSFFLPL